MSDYHTHNRMYVYVHTYMEWAKEKKAEQKAKITHSF